jgi:hypothetical protein
LAKENARWLELPGTFVIACDSGNFALAKGSASIVVVVDIARGFIMDPDTIL